MYITISNIVSNYHTHYVGLQMLCSGLTIPGTESLYRYRKDQTKDIPTYYRKLSRLVCLKTNSSGCTPHKHTNGHMTVDEVLSSNKPTVFAEEDLLSLVIVSRFEHMCVSPSIIWNMALLTGLVGAFRNSN